MPSYLGFNTQPPEGGWQGFDFAHHRVSGFNTQPPEGGWPLTRLVKNLWIFGFNTQPPEGGWPLRKFRGAKIPRFNTQPPEGGWPSCICRFFKVRLFQHTAARRRLDTITYKIPSTPEVSTHSRPKAAGPARRFAYQSSRVSTHSRPKAAGTRRQAVERLLVVSTHSRPKAAGQAATQAQAASTFQHTAARRRLE